METDVRKGSMSYACVRRRRHDTRARLINVSCKVEYLLQTLQCGTPTYCIILFIYLVGTQWQYIVNGFEIIMRCIISLTFLTDHTEIYFFVIFLFFIYSP